MENRDWGEFAVQFVFSCQRKTRRLSLSDCVAITAHTRLSSATPKQLVTLKTFLSSPPFHHHSPDKDAATTYFLNIVENPMIQLAVLFPEQLKVACCPPPPSVHKGPIVHHRDCPAAPPPVQEGADGGRQGDNSPELHSLRPQPVSELHLFTM